jgi:membrane-associated phospholipid phosphatase
MTGLLAAAGAAGAQVPTFGDADASPPKELESPGGLDPLEESSRQRRRADARHVRDRATKDQYRERFPEPKPNGDERRYGHLIGSFSKSLPHNRIGHVHLRVYRAFYDALARGDVGAIEALPIGPVGLVGPQSSLAYHLEGGDAWSFFMPPAPAFASAEEAGEMVELYWHALARDVPFNRYGETDLTMAAADDLSALSRFRGPKREGRVTPQTLFRGPTPGDLAGPYISQFLLLPVPYGSIPMDQKLQTTAPGIDYATDDAEWLRLQNGQGPSVEQIYDPEHRYIRNGRDMAEWVHRDFLSQLGLSAALILMGMGAPLNRTNPYRRYRRQAPFVTFGGPDVVNTLTRVANAAMKAAWFQKWFVHRRLRPEEFAGRVQNSLLHKARYPIHRELFDSLGLPEHVRIHSTALLSQAYAEACPSHPAYPSGHATFAGACVTALKALFDESFELPNPVVASDDGFSLAPWTGEPLTVGGELNKLAANIAIGRDFAGIHWRSDGVEGMKLGEEVAISVLRDLKQTYHEPFEGFRFKRFNGKTATI